MMANRFSAGLHAWQHRLGHALEIDGARRTETVLVMLTNNARRAPGYWIQLFLSMGIATLGLVLGSTAVVIGGMLVSPLMGPIVELGMGFAVGSAPLVVRATVRVLLSVGLVVLGAAIITVLLPFHDVTSEISSRAAPTALDLAIAVFCALAAAYTTVRPGADTTAAAAGTAIGIALVPPLCTIGFGLGTRSAVIARGAALLFTANATAIIVVAAASFFALGFRRAERERVAIARAEQRAQLGDFATQALERAFGSRFGTYVRLLVPAVLLVAVFTPLRQALREVSWQVRTRDRIRHIVTAEAPRALQSSITVGEGSVALKLFVVDSLGRTRDLERRLTRAIRERTGVTPAIDIIAVPDARTLTALTATAPAATAAPEHPLRDASDRIDAALVAAWPTDVAGAIAGWTLVTSGAGVATVSVRHVGMSLGPAGAAVLARALTSAVDAPVRVTDVALPAEIPLGARTPTSRWADSVRRVVALIAPGDSVAVCLHAPAPASAPALRQMLTRLRDSATARPIDGVVDSASRTWTVRLAPDACGGTPPNESPASRSPAKDSPAKDSPGSPQ